jgi:hypothetical protein
LTRSRAREVLLAAALAAATAGCSWLVGVSDDPIVTDGFGVEAGDEVAETQPFTDSATAGEDAAEADASDADASDDAPAE